MEQTARNIFRAVHEGKWLSIEYRNKKDEITKYWIAVHGIDPKNKTLEVEGFHLTLFTTDKFPYIYVDSILSSSVVDGSYYEGNPHLVRDISENPEKYRNLFASSVNLKILDYLTDCSRLDTRPYQSDYSLIHHLDGECLAEGEYALSDAQFKEIVNRFQEEAAGAGNRKNWKLRQLSMNVLSIVVKGKGRKRESLYVLAYKRLFLDVKKRVLKPAKEITICREFTVSGECQSIRKFLDPSEHELLEDFEKNQELIKNRIMSGSRAAGGVDDRPYLIALESEVKVDLNYEYGGILTMFEEDRATYPVRAFFGNLTAKPGRRKDYPITLLQRRANLDQLLAIHNAVKYPVTYVQGPPGTGKSYSIVNTIVTAFFNEKTVLLTSYNNHPIDTVVKDLQAISYKGNGLIPFPVIRLGSDEKVSKALVHIKELYQQVKKWKVFENTLEKNRDDKANRMKQLTALLKRHEEILALREQKEAIECLMGVNKHLTFQTDLQGRQLERVQERLAKIGEVTDEQALALLDNDEEEFKKYLYFTSVKYLKRLGEPKNADLWNIVEMKDKEYQVKAFNEYLGNPENVRKFLRIFPVVASTCISSHKIGHPEPYFDLVVMDEASQCNTALSLVPIIRGENLMLVGDPQQLNPVILLDRKDNEILKKRYMVPDEYDYCKNSIYKAFLANDSVSDEILLRHHYRCSKQIIQFNNMKYYNNRLNIDSRVQAEQPLVFLDVQDNRTDYKNTAPREAEIIAEYVRTFPDRKIGIITPFTNQKECISEMLAEHGLHDVSCGTVHAFQGDEKDIILFSLAITDQTTEKTYEWLKNNRELINVATSRAREQLVIVSDRKNLDRLHREEEKDDVYELVEYVKTKGSCKVTPDEVHSRALGVKPYSTETERAFLTSLNHALENILGDNRKCSVKKEVSISQVFEENTTGDGLFYNGRFDFVLYEKEFGDREIPVLAIELDGKEHLEDESVKRRDKRKEAICRDHGFELIRVENSYARRYYYIKHVLEEYFKHLR